MNVRITNPAHSSGPGVAFAKSITVAVAEVFSGAFCSNTGGTPFWLQAYDLNAAPTSGDTAVLPFTETPVAAQGVGFLEYPGRGYPLDTGLVVLVSSTQGYHTTPGGAAVAVLSATYD